MTRQEKILTDTLVRLHTHHPSSARTIPLDKEVELAKENVSITAGRIPGGTYCAVLNEFEVARGTHQYIYCDATLIFATHHVGQD